MVVRKLRDPCLRTDFAVNFCESHVMSVSKSTCHIHSNYHLGLGSLAKRYIPHATLTLRKGLKQIDCKCCNIYGDFFSDMCTVKIFDKTCLRFQKFCISMNILFG